MFSSEGQWCTDPMWEFYVDVCVLKLKAKTTFFSLALGMGLCMEIASSEVNCSKAQTLEDS